MGSKNRTTSAPPPDFEDPSADSVLSGALREDLLPSSQAHPDRPGPFNGASLFSGKRLVFIAILLAVIGIGWLCFAGPVAPILEAALSNRMASVPPTETSTPTLAPSPTTAPTETPLPPKPTNTPRPSATTVIADATLAISSTLEASATPTVGIGDCIPAPQITLDDVGKDLCVTGFVDSTKQTDRAFMIFLLDAPGGFYFASYERSWDLASDICIFASGKIEQIGASPIMQIGYRVPLQYCTP